MSRSAPLGLVALVAIASASAAPAEEPPIEVNPNRPTFATPARTTQLGVAEIEWGVDRSTFRGGADAFLTPTLLKLGLADDFELRIATNGWVRLTAPGARSASGTADLALGAQWCYLHGGPLGFDQAVQVTHKFPTADVSEGLGSGVADDTVALFASRDFGDNHADLNVLETWQGVPAGAGSGRVRVPAATVSVSHNLSPRWSFGGEVYGIGGSALATRWVSTLWYAAYKPSPRLVLDGGVEVGLSDGAPRYSVFAGLTWGIGRFLQPGVK